MINETVLAYHQRTKHDFERYARGPTHINWYAQPEAFRHYIGAKRFELPEVADSLNSRYLDLYQPNTITPQPLTLNHIAALLELSLGISAWKQYGENRWALRCNPSSGNLHPTEGYILLPNLDDIPAGVYHYMSRDHVLEQRGLLDENSAESLKAALSKESFLFGLTSIPWREAWKYGERAFRYCQHDIGHAIAAIRYAAATLGWRVLVLDNWADTDIITTLGLDQHTDFNPQEPEVAEVMLCIEIPAIQEENNSFPISRLSSDAILPTIMGTTWAGKANVLDPQHDYEWPIIDTVLEATLKPVTIETNWAAPPLPPLLPIACTQRAADLIRQRRSAQRFDGVTPLSQEAFYRILDSTLPRPSAAPWDVFPHQPHLHLVLFVHRITGLTPGLYILLRREGIEEKLRTALQHEDFEWNKPACPKHLQLYQLLSGDGQKIAEQISCHQQIASGSAFSLGMLAEFENTLQSKPWAYKHLFWEAGIIGQTLYLEAEAVGARGTGIGCYFDDAFHSLLGLNGIHYQSLYHFTVGTPLRDLRLE